MDLKPKCFAALIIAGLFTAGAAMALMPPHVSGTVPENNGMLAGDTFVLHGYSLEYAPTETLQVIDLTSGQAAPIRRDMQCKWEGEGDCPGCRQQACTMTIKLLSPSPGHTYEFRFLDENYRFTVAPQSGSQP